MKKTRHARTYFELGRKKWLLLPLLTIFVATIFVFTRSKAQEEPRVSNGRQQVSPQQRLEPFSSQAVGFAETIPLSEIAKKRVAPDRESEEAEENEAAENRAIKHASPAAQLAASVEGGAVQDGALQVSIPAANAMATPNVTFEGLGRSENIAAGFGSFSPSDTNGTVGPNHYVQQTNVLVRVWNKTGTPLTAPFKLSGLFAPLGGICSTNDNGDPIVLYDEMADRWLLSQFAFTGTGSAPPFHQCIAVSKTADPTGQYYVYDFQTPGNNFPDYPHLGVWPDGYYMTVNQFTEPGDIFNGTGAYSFNRTKMLAGDPTANFIYFNLSSASFPENIGGMLPSDMDGITPPPPGRANVFAYFTTTDFSDPANGLRLFNFHSDFATPANSTFTERAESSYAAPLAVAAFSVITPTGNQGRQAVPQPSPATASSALDAITDRLMHRMQYRNRGGFETLVVNHTVGAPASTTFGTFRAAPRYYELRSTAGGAYSVQEQATYAPADGVSRWMGSAAEDNQGNLAVGFNVSSTSVFPGIRYAGRLATDPAGGLAQGEATLIDGTGVQTSTGNRWGDYSALTVDPVDDCTFWYTTEYYTAAGQAASSVGWQTRIGSFKFPTCTAPAKGTAHFTITDCASAGNLQNAVITVDGLNYGVSATDGSYNATLAPGSHTYSVTKFGSSTTTGSFNITNGNTTNVPVCVNASPVMSANGASLTVDPNNNGAIDPGETVTVSFGVRNDGDAPTTNLVGTLQATGGVTSPGAPANYGAVAAGGGTAAQSISFTANNSLTCGSTLTATVHLQDGANDLGNAQYTFTLCPIVVVTATAGTVGPTGYATVKQAFDAINAGTHQGAVTVSINSSTTEGTTPATLNGSGAGSASYTSVLIRPINDGLSVSGNPAGGLGVIQLNGASNVTIDGDNPNSAGTNRNLTIQNTAANTTTFTSAIRIALATTNATTANNDTIKNVNILGSATGRNVSGATSSAGSENTTYGILASSGSTGVTAAPAAVTSVTSTIGSPATATNLLIQNNTVNTAGRAISVQGSATTVFAGLQVKDNVIGNPTSGNANQVYSGGIMVNGTSNGLVSGNLLYTEGFVASSTSGANQSISLGTISTATTATVEKNRVARVHNNATDTWPAIGINMGGGNNHVVQNNFVFDIQNSQVAGFGGGGTTFGAYGIRANSGTGHKVYHNSVHLFGTLAGSTSTDLTAAFIIVNTTQTGMDVRNNIFSNQQTGGNPSGTNTRHTVLYLPSGGTSAMNLTLNNNSYLQGPSGTGALSLLAKVGTAAGTGEFLASSFNPGATTPATNLRSYTSTLSAAGTNDNASNAVVFNPPFTSNTDLHVPAGTQAPWESGGASVGVTVDIDGQTRPGPTGSVNGGGTAPDEGADEYDGVPSAFATPLPTPTPSPSPSPSPGPCAPLSEVFDNITTLPGAGWVQTNHSSPIGSTGWFQGNPDVFPSHSGTPNAYIGANFNNTTGTNTISNWLILPTMTLRDGDTFSFWTRTTDVGAQVFPDRVQVRLSTNSTSSDVGTTATDVGDFTTLLLDINPTYTDSYPHVWTQYTVTISGLGTSGTVGRLAFRYFVEGGGPTGTHSDYIGIDDVAYTCLPPTNVAVNDATASEPPSGTSQMLFTVTLTQPAPGGGLSVNYSTADGSATGGASCDGTKDYVNASGTATVPAGSQVATIPVTICADNASGESNETLLVNISSPSFGAITDNQATGTITPTNTAGTILISELRTSGPAGAGDDFVEIYNNSDTPHTVNGTSGGYGLFKMGSDCSATPILIGMIPNGTVLPARGHYLFVGSAYSLANYGGTAAAAGDQTLTSDIENDRNVAIFSTVSLVNVSSATRLDAVGFGTNTGGFCDLVREGSNLGAMSGSALEYSFFRKQCDFANNFGCSTAGTKKDTNDNSADFTFADTAATVIAGVAQRLGAPGPENFTSPRTQGTTIAMLPLDVTQTNFTAPNRVRSLSSGTNAAFGTLSIRRRIQNNTGGTVTRLRFRIIEMTTKPNSVGTADLRGLTSSDTTAGPILDPATCSAESGSPAPPCLATIRGTTLETPPAQELGGGYNSTLSAGIITTGTPLANGASINVQFLLGVEQAGNFRLGLIVESLPNGGSSTFLLTGNTDAAPGTTTTLSSDVNPSTSGQLVTFTAAVAENPANPFSDTTGTVDFIDTSNGNAVICNDVPLNGSFQATCPTSTLTDGTHNIRADYSGDSNFASSQSNVIAQGVNPPCITNPIVTTNSDSGAGSLRQAISDACVGSTITFAGTVVSPITLTTGELVINKNLTIQGPGANLLTISGNNASRIFNLPGGTTNGISGLTLANATVNSAGTNEGGAIFNNATLTVTGSAITGNSVSGGTSNQGGGIFNSGALILTNTTLSGNSAAGSGNTNQFGGGIANAGTATLANCTVSGNTINGSLTSSNRGGGVYSSAGTTTIVNCTISGNNLTPGSTSEGGGIDVNGGTVTVRNTIVAGNTASAAPDLGGGFSSPGNNLIGKADGSTGFTNGVNGDKVGTSASPLNALLAALGDYGGPTRTHALLPGSPAIDAGNNCVTDVAHCSDANIPQLANDQRGQLRQVNSAVDMGAFESRGFTIAISSGNAQSAFINTAFVSPLIATVSSGFSEPVNGGQVTFTAPGSGASASASFTGGVSTISATVDGSHQATMPASANGTAGGPYNVSASGSGISSPVSFSLTNLKGNQTITFGAIADRPFGPDFGITATASSALPVSFSASGQCTVTSPSPATVHLTGAGSCTITASQLGDSNYNPATNVPQTFTIAKASSSTAVTSSVNPSDFGQNVTFTATVTSGGGTPGGQVQFKDGGSSLGAAVTLNGSGVATFTTSTLTTGTHTITVDYLGNANFASSTGTLAGGQVVKPQPSLSINDAAIVEGNSGTKVLSFTVTLSTTSSLTVTANYATANSTATAPSDYAAIASTLLTFNSGDTSKTVAVTINGDINFEPDETFTVNLSNPTNATLSKAAGTGTIQNDDAQGGFVSFNQANYSVNESAGTITVTVIRTNDVTHAATVDYATDDTGSSTNCAALNTGLASQRCDFTPMFGTLKFAANEAQKTIDIPINLDGFTEGPETFMVKVSNLTGGAVLVAPAAAIVTITDSASPTPNAIDDTTVFVRQQYRDFLNRDADAAGLQFWKNNIDKCNDPAQRPPGQTLAQCIEVQRILTSGSFFLSIEFRQTGGLVRDFYVAALDRPLTGNMPNFVEFMRDTQAIQKGVVVGQGNWQQVLDANRLAFMNEFVMRAEFVGLYPTTDTPTQYVNKLYQHAGLTPAAADRAAAIAEFGNAATAADPSARARALLRVTQDQAFQARELPRAFVQMQYFGYLRRNPNDPPDNNFNGFNFWLNKLIQFNGDFQQAEMVKAFISSLEYRGRFGP